VSSSIKSRLAFVRTALVSRESSMSSRNQARIDRPGRKIDTTLSF
jgi:hypothetical protein